MEQIPLDFSEAGKHETPNLQALSESELEHLYTEMMGRELGAKFFTKERLIAGLSRGKEEEEDVLREEANEEDKDDIQSTYRH